MSQSPVDRLVPYQWPRGVSGNPGGKSKDLEHVAELARQHTAAAIRALVDVLSSKHQPARVAAACALLDRAWGRPVQSVHITERARVLELVDIAPDGRRTVRTIVRGTASPMLPDGESQLPVLDAPQDAQTVPGDGQ